MKKYLLVEGITDVAFVKYVCLKRGITKKFDDFDKKNNRYVFYDFIIVDLTGQDKLSTVLTFLNEEIDDIDKIGIIQDADDDFEKSAQSIDKALKEAKINKEKIEYFLTPNNKDNGDFETLLLSTIEDNKIIDCFNDYGKCLKKDSDIHPKALNKGKVHAYTMYSQKGKKLYKPQDSFVRKDKDTKLWDLSKKEFTPIIDFVSKVFNKN